MVKLPSNTNGVVIFDGNGNILEANCAFLEMLAYGQEQSSALNWEGLASPEYRIRDQERLARLASGDPRPWYTELVSRDGQRVPVLVEAEPVDGSADQFRGLVLDIGMEGAHQDRLAGELLKLYDAERRSIARELHDTTAQNLAALSMTLGILAGALGDTPRSETLLADCASLTEECLKEVRSISYRLHPPLLDELGLEAAVRTFVDLYTRRTGVAVHLEFQTPLGRLIPQQAELAAFRIIQESLFNVHEHSESRKAEVHVGRDGMLLEVRVRDWGTKMEGGSIPLTGLGIAAMRERATALGGRLEIGAVEPGVLVRALLPLEP